MSYVQNIIIFTIMITIYSLANAIELEDQGALIEENHDFTLSRTFIHSREDNLESNVFSVTRFIRVNYSVEAALNTLWNIENLERYEPKVFSAHVEKKTDKTGSYIAWGFFGIMPWRGTFSYTLTDTGFTSELLNSPIESFGVKGGFLVRGDGDNQCQIIHYEKYRTPDWLRCLTPMIKSYVGWSMERELKNIVCIISKTAPSFQANSEISKVK
ncbi:MAG TPA: hypothetical protein PLY23_06230 [Alphaproteobacteria bacterium]|nr:MAG: hypothetical protein B7X84_05845 [Alphaproteobacteria bacterium 17-39-52]HQS84483.1 hypothetical protein [Alphaproteobacteria bacterium]HQS93668.1 hypothetical protein [Alphaproteobacteria bacterium]